VTVKGVKSFRFRRKLRGKDLNITIGQYPEMTVEQARKAAIGIANDINNGINPNQIKCTELAELELERTTAVRLHFGVEFLLKRAYTIKIQTAALEFMT